MAVRVLGMGRACPAGLGGEGAERGWEGGGTTCQQLAGLPEGGRCEPGTLAERAPTGLTVRPSNSRAGRGCLVQGVPLFWGLPCPQSWTNLGRILDASLTSEGWRKARRMPTDRGRETPQKKEGGRLGGSASVNRRRDAGCGGVYRSYLLAKPVGCYSHPKCFSLPSEARRKNIPQSEAETRPKRLKNESGL